MTGFALAEGGWSNRANRDRRASVLSRKHALFF